MNLNFGEIWKACATKSYKDFMIVDGYLVKGNLLCIPLCSLRMDILDELHNGTLGGHFGRTKTL